MSLRKRGHGHRDYSGSQRIGELQARQQKDEFRSALRALLMRPLLGPSHPDFPAIRRQATKLREWFAREVGWVLHVERDGARLYKRPADLTDPTRGLAGYDRRRYVLLCLACAVLERADPQITLHLLGERVMDFAAEPTLRLSGFTFTLGSAGERRDLVTVCRTLLDLGVLQRIAGDEEGFVHAEGGPHGDALYDIQRRALSGMLAAVRGPSTWAPAEAPVSTEARLRALVAEHVPDSDDGRRAMLRHALSRRLLDDPVIYTDSLDTESQAYFANQRGPMAARLCEATGMVPEQRAEGLALTDEGTLTDIAMPAEGTEAHVTLLVAEHLAGQYRESGAGVTITNGAIAAFIRLATDRYGHYWRKSAREPGAERELTQIALGRLGNLQLIARDGELIRPLPAIARFSLGNVQVQATQTRTPPQNATLF